MVLHSSWPDPGPRFKIKMPPYQYRKSHYCGGKTIVRSYTGITASLYWIRDLVRWHSVGMRRCVQWRIYVEASENRLNSLLWFLSSNHKGCLSWHIMQCIYYMDWYDNNDNNVWANFPVVLMRRTPLTNSLTISHKIQDTLSSFLCNNMHATLETLVTDTAAERIERDIQTSRNMLPTLTRHLHWLKRINVPWHSQVTRLRKESSRWHFSFSDIFLKVAYMLFTCELTGPWEIQMKFLCKQCST